MNLKNRIKKIESQVPPVTVQPVWDFTSTTTEQLYRLRDLQRSGDERGSRDYTKQLIDQGFLSCRTGGKRI